MVTDVLSVTRLYRYPVKSMQGESVSSLAFREGHVAGDRQWAVVDPATGYTLSAKRHGVLLECSARLHDTGVLVAVPGDGEHEVSTGEADGPLSDLLGRAVVLRQAGAPAAPIELLVDPLDEGSEVISLPIPTTHFADLADAHLLTTSSLRAASALHPEGDWDVRRFRPTALIEGAPEGFFEDDWVGSTVRLGATASIEIFMPTVRCSMPPRSQPGLERDPAVVRVLKDHHDMCLGVYGASRAEGTVSVGDPVVVVG